MEQVATREIPTLGMMARVLPESINKDGRTVDVVWTTGARVKRGFWETYYEELSLEAEHVRLERLSSGGAPVMDNHNGYGSVADTVIGVVQAAKLEGKRGVATLRFARAEIDPNAERIFRKIEDGIITQVSVGYRVHVMREIERADDRIPVYRAEDWEPYEISIVPVGADAGAVVRSESGGKNACKVVRNSELEERMEPEIKKPVEQVDTKRIADEAALEERARCQAIKAAVRAASLGDEAADKMIADGVDINGARALVLEQLAARSARTETRQQIPAIERGQDEHDKFIGGATAAMLARCGKLDLVRRAAKQSTSGVIKMPDGDGGEFRGMSLLRMAEECLTRAGVNVRGMSPKDIASAAFTTRTGMATTGDFPVLLENVMHKVLLAAYEMQQTTWRRWCGTATLTDFRVHNLYRAGSFGVYDSVNEHGELLHKAIPDGSKRTLSVATKGNIIAVTRELVINDDLAALANLMQELGIAGQLTIESDVYALLAQNGGLGPTQGDGNPFFHSTRGNVNASASGHTVAGWDADRVIMGEQKDHSGNKFLGLMPRVLVVANGQKAAAEVLNKDTWDHDTAKLQKPSAVVGMFEDIVATPYLTGTRRYVCTDRGIAPVVVVAFLEGSGEAPILESQQGWSTLGVEMRAYMDFRAQMGDPKGGVTNAGA